MCYSIQCKLHYFSCLPRHCVYISMYMATIKTTERTNKQKIYMGKPSIIYQYIKY